jgi:drug/metabolite transporter superfamily protein YnfA
MEWTLSTVLLVSLLFLLAGLAEIGGGWLVWQAVREGKPAWWAAAGSAVLVAYGFVPTLQPLDNFGRLYAVYGGVFIGMSFAWGYAVDGMVPDRGDLVGSAIALLGVAMCLFWPRGEPRPGAHALLADGAGHPQV